MAVARTRSTRAVPDADSYAPAEATTKRRYDEDPDDEAPRGRSRAESNDEDADEDPDAPSARSSIVQTGWGAAKKAMSDNDNEYTGTFKAGEDFQVVAFLTGEVTVYKQHWLNNREGKKSFVCLEPQVPNGSCPLCLDLADKPAWKYSWPLVNLSKEGMPTEILTTGVRLATQLEKLHLNPKQGPLETGFYAISKTGLGKDTLYQVSYVKERDLLDDYDIDPDDVATALGNATDPGEDAIQVNTRKELQEVADELS